jgi:hypothetical protein
LGCTCLASVNFCLRSRADLIFRIRSQIMMRRLALPGHDEGFPDQTSGPT